MSTLAKAHLQALSGDASPRVLNEFDVQFNPATLQLKLGSSLEGGATQGAQARQHLGRAASTLSFELHFDTADEGSDGAPRSVREKTAQIEQFVLPQGREEGQEAPPRVKFHWGDLIITGVVESLTLDMDFFSPEGIPLRAKMGVTIKEQDPRFELPEAGTPGPLPARAGGAPGTAGSGGARSAAALAGESAAGFAARMGLDAAAWRGLSGGLEGTLSLEAGAEIGFSAELSASAGLGASVGIEAGAGASLEASFGLSASAGASLGASLGGSASLSAGASLGASVSVGAAASVTASASAGVSAGGAASAGLAAGFALSSSGGFSAAVETVRGVRVEAAASQARASFGVPTPTPAPSAARVTSAARPVGSGARSSAGAPVASLAAPATSRPSRPAQPRPRLQSTRPEPEPAPAPRPPRADPRGVSYGFGVPLRPRAVPPSGVASADGVVALKPRAGADASASRPDPGAAPWTYLPAERSRPSERGARGGADCGCGCNGSGAKRTTTKRKP